MPLLDGNGLFLVVKDNITNELKVCCDECYQYQDFKTIDYLKKDFSKRFVPFDQNFTYVNLEEALERGWAEYIYILENGKWLKYTDKTKQLF